MSSSTGRGSRWQGLGEFEDKTWLQSSLATTGLIRELCTFHAFVFYRLDLSSPPDARVEKPQNLGLWHRLLSKSRCFLSTTSLIQAQTSTQRHGEDAD